MAVRVGRLKRKIYGFMASSDYRLTLEPVSTQTIRHLRAIDQYPPDILMLLEQIGCVRNLGYNDHALIDWWTPCTIDHALVGYRCRFQLSNSDLKPLLTSCSLHMTAMPTAISMTRRGLHGNLSYVTVF